MDRKSSNRNNCTITIIDLPSATHSIKNISYSNIYIYNLRLIHNNKKKTNEYNYSKENIT
jgi:hypothetical protein